jgi:hypothetical protein
MIGGSVFLLYGSLALYLSVFKNGTMRVKYTLVDKIKKKV